MAKGFSILCVVMYHADLAARSLGYDPAYAGAINAFLQPVRMPLFFCISGALAAGAIARPWPVLLATKVWPYVYLFALWGLIRWVYFGYVVENVRNTTEGTDLIQLATMWIYPTSALWFIWALAIYFVVAKLTDRVRTLALLAALLLACLTWGGLVPLAVNHRNLCTYLFFFLLGAYHSQSLLTAIPRRPLTIFAVAGAAFLVIEYIALPGVGRGLAGGSLRALESILGLVAGSAGAVLASRWDFARNGLAFIGRHTLPVYVTHVLFISALAALLVPFAGSEPWRYAIVPLLVIVAVAGSMLVEAAANRFGFPWLYRAPVLKARPEPVTP